MESENYNSEFIGGLEIWENTYNLLIRKGAKDHALLTSLALKNLTRAAAFHFYFAYGKKERDKFELVLEKLKRVFDPETELGNLKIGTTLCIELKPNSYLVEKFETGKICAKYLSLELESRDAQIKSDLTGQYENVVTYLSVCLAYPTKNDVLEVTWPDIENIEAFAL